MYNALLCKVVHRAPRLARGLFSLPSWMQAPNQTHQERRLIRFPPHTIYSVVADVTQYKHFVPWCVDSRVLVSRPNYIEAELAVGFQVLSERYVSKVTLDPGRRVEAIAKSTQLFHYLRNEWCFAPGPTADTCFVDFRVDFAFRSVLYTQASNLFFDEVVSKMVAAYEKRCEVIYNSELQALQADKNTEEQAHQRAITQEVAADASIPTAVVRIPSTETAAPTQPMAASSVRPIVAVQPTTQHLPTDFHRKREVRLPAPLHPSIW